jgi:geranylgeranyl diphosphate synthase type I
MNTCLDESTGRVAQTYESNPLTALYRLIRARIADLTPKGWPDLAREIEMHVTRFDFPPAILLPVAACAAVGGSPRRAVSSAAGIAFVLLSARWLDDLADRDRADGLWRALGAGRATLFGTSALALAFKALASDAGTPREAAECLATYSLAMASGQDKDLTGAMRTLDAYWELMRGKTGAGFALACELGAICAGARSSVAGALTEFGMHLGVLLQILDDLEGCFRPTGIGDFQQGKVTLPAIYALAIGHARRGELQDLVDGGALGKDFARATEIVESAGARRYCVWAALEERKRALSAIERLPSPADDIARAGHDALSSFLALPFHGLPEIL